MKQLVLSFYLLVMGLLSFAQEQNPAKGLDLDALNTYIENTRSAWEIPGMAVAIVKNGEVVFAKGYGVLEVDKKQPVDKHSVFAVASNTKAFTSAALARLVDEQRISWDDKVVDYLPYFRLYDPYVTDQVTIRDLLCHRVGLKTFSGDLLWYHTNYTTEEIIRRARHLEPVYGFRSHYGYSNIMFATAGEVIEAVTDSSWAEYVTAHFIEPLEMERTTTSVKTLKKMKNVAHPHDKVNGTMQPIPYLPWDNMAAAAAINSSVHDMAQWLKLQLNNGTYNGQSFFSPAQSWEMWSPHTVQPISQGRKRMIPEQHFRAYGLGWQLEDYHGHKVVSHGGGSDGMISKTAMLPDENLGFVILTNSINYLPTALMYHIIDNYLGITTRDWSELYLSFYNRRKANEKQERAALEAARDKNSSPSLPLEAYTGTYGGKLYGNAQVFIEDDHLVVDLLPAPTIIGDLSHWQHNSFEIALRNNPSLPTGWVNFLMNKDGEVTEMQIDIPNPDFFFDELTFKRQSE